MLRQSYFPNFGQGAFPEIEEKSPACMHSYLDCHDCAFVQMH